MYIYIYVMYTKHKHTHTHTHTHTGAFPALKGEPIVNAQSDDGGRWR